MSETHPGADEQFCQSCGETIKRKAELCPHCGVRNSNATQDNRAARTTAYTSNVSEDWWYGIALSAVVWLLIGWISVTTVNAVNSAGISGFVSVLGRSMFEGLLRFGVWILLPFAFYLDAEYVRESTEWQVSGGLYAGVAAVLPVAHFVLTVLAVGSAEVLALVAPLAGAGLCGVYLQRRSDRVGVP